MASDSNIVRKQGRILYVEPNDIYGSIDGVPITPDYSDYCISVNLIAEVVSRFKQSGDDATKKFIITWTTRPGVDSDGNDANPNNWISFLQGQDAEIYGGEGNFLTTYYTDINYDDILNNNIVEGLGIESVQVSFESYYTPTVVIKFIDVRGASLFGREEAVHDNGGNLTASSVFGVFFTVPYPKFKLQIKGFYGHAVTYQLTCSDFRASFNAQTGNFEAVATFIGYSYSLLTDIPLRYIVAAPYCNYVGKSYWDKRVNSSEWALSDGSRPKPLFEIIDDIRGLIVADEEDLINKLTTSEEAEEKNNLEKEKTLLRTLSTSLAEYVESLKKLAGNGKWVMVASTEPDDSTEQLMLFSDSKEITVAKDSSIILASQNLINSFDEYNTSFPSKRFSDKLLPNESRASIILKGDDKIKLTNICNVTKSDDGKVVSVTFNCKPQNVAGISTIKVNDRKISNVLATRLYEEAIVERKAEYFSDYAYLTDFNKFLGVINERIENLEKSDKELNDSIKLRVQNAARDVLGFTPYIGDVFKIIMCHLETFIHMMWECYHNILNSDRSPKHLNISINDTDFVNVKKDAEVGPWPGVFNNGAKTKEGGEIDKASDGTIAWVGDFSSNFEEERFIKELYIAVQKCGVSEQKKAKPMTMITTLPVMPNDINNTTQIFSNGINNNLSSLSGYLSFRAAQIFGILFNTDVSVELASALGKMDAYNYFTYCQSRSDIQNKLISAISNYTMEDVLYNISICNSKGDEFCEATYENTGKKRHDFETRYCISKEYNKQNRHPMLVEDGNDVKYVHYYTESKVGLVPDKMIPYKQYKSMFVYEGAPDNPHFDYTFRDENTFVANDFIHKSSSRALIGDDAVLGEYINDNMFSVETDEAFGDSIVQKYEDLKSGTFNIYGDEFTDDFSSVLDKIWHISPSDYGEYFADNAYMLSKGFSELGIEENELYPDSKDAGDPKKAPKTLNNEKWLVRGDSSITFDSSKNAWVDNNGAEQTLGNLIIRYVQSTFLRGDNLEYQDLFGDPFYYVQNNGWTNKDSDEVIYTRNCVKALLFLHTLQYNHKNIAGFLKQNKNCGGIYSLPYGYILLLGGLLWRQKYYIENGEDPIKHGKNYRKVGIDNTLFVQFNHSQYRMCAFLNSDKDKPHIKVATLFGGGNNWMPDQYVTNKLISLFKSFVNGSWLRIMSKLELKNNSTVGGRHTEPYTEEVFIPEVIDFKNDLAKCQKQDKIKKTNGVELAPNVYILERLYYGTFYFGNFFDNYKYIYVRKDFLNGDARGLLLLLNEKNTEIQNELKSLYTKRVIVSDSSGIRHSYNGSNNVKEIKFNSNTFKAYLQGFSSKIEDISKNRNTEVPQEYGTTDVTFKRDILISMYLYIKVLWDKWLVSTNTKKFKDKRVVKYEDYYNVENFYNSFVFIDAFYKNIYSKFIINCETLKTAYDGRDEDGSLFQFIGDIVSDHHCLFLALPDYVDMGHNSDKKAFDEMKNMFRPMAYNDMNGVDDENRFVIIYTPRMSEIPTGNNNFREDFIRIWNPAESKFDDKMPGVYKDEPAADNDNIVTRYGYYVPSFGVAFSRQNNHLFKDIRLNMTTPLVTSASINALANIAYKAASTADHKVAFMGQDLYPVFSNYSYICEIEMMGDAQVQPLMYFQLMNIPMWSGVYMIFNVTHNITAGNMTTTFKGMKLSRNPLPYNSSWYMFKPSGDGSVGYEQNEYSSSDGYSLDAAIPSSYPIVTNPSDHFHEKKNQNIGTGSLEKYGNVTVDPNIIKIYNSLYEEIAELPENKPKMKWNVCISHVIRHGIDTGSDHYKGHAIDLRVMKFDDNGNVNEHVHSGNYQRELYKVADILYCNHRDEVRQVLPEYNKASDMSSARKYNLNVLHVATVYNSKDKHEFMICAYMPPPKEDALKNKEGKGRKKGKYGNIIKGHDKEWFISNIPEEFKMTAARHYKASKSTFRAYFPNFSECNEDDFKRLFGNAVSGGENTAHVNSTFMQWYEWSMSWEGEYGGITKIAREQYVKDGGKSGNPTIKEIALVSSWNANHLSDIKDPSVALVCMYTIFWTGNCSLIYNSLNDYPYSKTKATPWRLKTNDIATINSRSPQILFNKIKKQAGEYILNPPSWASLPSGEDPGPGWRRRWFSINYGPSLVTNGGMGTKRYSEQDLRDAMAKL